MMTHVRRIWLRLTTNRKQFGILCTMVALGLLLWARLIIVSSMPKTALADDKMPDFVEPVSDLTDAETSPTTDNRSGGVTEIALDGEPQRDPFTVSDDFFPFSSQTTQNPPDSGKSPSERVEEFQQSEARLRARLQGQFDLFSLDAVMTNADMAVINGQIYRLEDEVAGVSDESIRFRLAEIRKRSVVLTAQGREFELKIETPGG